MDSAVGECEELGQLDGLLLWLRDVLLEKDADAERDADADRDSPRDSVDVTLMDTDTRALEDRLCSAEARDVLDGDGEIDAVFGLLADTLEETVSRALCVAEPVEDASFVLEIEAVSVADERGETVRGVKDAELVPDSDTRADPLTDAHEEGDSDLGGLRETDD